MSVFDTFDLYRKPAAVTDYRKRSMCILKSIITDLLNYMYIYHGQISDER